MSYSDTQAGGHERHDATTEYWREIAASTRIALEKRIADIAVMTPEEMRMFVLALAEAEELEIATEVRLDRIEHAREHWE